LLESGKCKNLDKSKKSCGAAAQGASGPNGGGKSSMLCYVCAAALLAMCGLMVPACEASVPQLDAIMLRMMSTDSPADTKSSFQMVCPIHYTPTSVRSTSLWHHYSLLAAVGEFGTCNVVLVLKVGSFKSAEVLRSLDPGNV
jgi:hypothetical protein